MVKVLSLGYLHDLELQTSNYLTFSKMSYDRREFIKKTILTGTTLSLANLDLRAYAQERTTKVRLGFIAVGLGGQTHLERNVETRRCRDYRHGRPR